MAAGESDEWRGLSPVRFSRLSRRGLLLGLSVVQVAVLAFAIVVTVGLLYSAGGGGLLLAVPVCGVCAGLVWVPVGGRKAIEWLPLAGHWGLRSAAGQTMYRRRVGEPRPAGTLALPGDAAALRAYLDGESRAVMVHDPHRATLTAVVKVSHPSFMLLDPADQQRRVAAWGRVLSTVCRSGRIARLQVLERTVPDSGAGLAQWWAAHGSDDGSWVAQTYKELIERAGPTAERHLSSVSVSLDMKAAGRAIRSAGGGMRGAASVLRAELRTLSAALRTAELRPGRVYDPGRLAVLLRSAYDPAVAATLERSKLGGALATAGPVAVEETWDRLRSDSAYHAVLWVSEWPRSQVYPGFLSPMLLSTGVRRAFTLLCEPLRADAAARDIRRKKTGYLSDASQRAKIGQIEDAQQSAEYRDVLAQEADLMAGHGLLRYVGLIAISAPSIDDLDAAVAAIEQAAVQASCETRRLVGQQAQAFAAAALPLCRGL
ncbi:MAG: SCO6880 family protein [Solirubrobacteraceae bacterium]